MGTKYKGDHDLEFTSQSLSEQPAWDEKLLFPLIQFIILDVE